MSDLSLRLHPATSQLLVSSYFDPVLLQRGPRYVGHQLNVPQPGDYLSLLQEAQGRALIRGPGGDFEFFLKVCPYQSPMEDGMQHFHDWYEKQTTS